MNADLDIALDWERIEEVSPEERSCFGMLQIRVGDIPLTEGQDGFINSVRRGPLVSGYHLAEWLAWNWWRLVREPRPDAPTHDWQFAHCMGTVGAGYLWPNITIISDRERTALIAKPTRPQGFSAFRFTADWAIVVPTTKFESALDDFMGRIQGKLRADGVAATNFDQIWGEVLEERVDPQSAAQRELEAVLGYDADEGDENQVQQLLADADELGRDAVLELSADHYLRQGLPTAADLADLARTCGSDTRPADMARVTELDLGARQRMPAGKKGMKRQEHCAGKKDSYRDPYPTTASQIFARFLGTCSDQPTALPLRLPLNP
jgi:hypothetical protein